MTTAWFVTGTDTGVGKTRASCALLHALRRRGLRCAGMKPVAAGIEPDSGCNDDVLRLRAAGNVVVPRELDNPVLLREPVSPHIAAAREGVTIDVGVLRERFVALRTQLDAVVVEGAGGFCVPLSDTATGADLAAALGLPVILVVSEIFGVHEYIADTARRFAKAGYLAIAPELFVRQGGERPGLERRDLAQPQAAQQLIARAEAVVDRPGGRAEGLGDGADRRRRRSVGSDDAGRGVEDLLLGELCGTGHLKMILDSII